MVKVIYSYRLLCDSHFLEWLAKQPERRQILNRLMYIKASSSDHRKKHNLILTLVIGLRCAFDSYPSFLSGAVSRIQE